MPVRAPSPALQPSGDATIGRRRAPVCGGPGDTELASATPWRAPAPAARRSTHSCRPPLPLRGPPLTAGRHDLRVPLRAVLRVVAPLAGRTAGRRTPRVPCPATAPTPRPKEAAPARNGRHALARAADRTAWRRVPLARRAAGSRPPRSPATRSEAAPFATSRSAYATRRRGRTGRRRPTIRRLGDRQTRRGSPRRAERRAGDAERGSPFESDRCRSRPKAVRGCRTAPRPTVLSPLARLSHQGRCDRDIQLTRW